jgi:hypothetical protein
VSLEGTLETIALPDVLALLSVTAKTGELRVESGGGVGSVWLDAGRVAGFDVGNQRSAVDALFALLRLRDGSFKFHTGTEAQNPLEPQEVAPLMEQAEERLLQWPAISAVVPSLSAQLNLEASVPQEVILSPDQWGLVAQIGGGHTVGEILDARSLGEFDGCKAVRDLVDMGLVKVDHFEAFTQPVVLSPSPSTEDLAPSSEDQLPPAPEYPQDGITANGITSNGWTDAELSNLSQVWNDETGRVETAPVEDGLVDEGLVDNGLVEEDAAEAGHPVNRGLLLKFLGSARS